MSPFANIGIISIGEMGLGMAELLAAHNYQVLTNVTGRRYISVLTPP
jgi:3-hydroxyisobutyrate dehydrogenase-like beta-hydroxyacid dehydrogenase